MDRDTISRSADTLEYPVHSLKIDVGFRQVLAWDMSQAFRFGFGGRDEELDEDEKLPDADPRADPEPNNADTTHLLGLEDVVSMTSDEYFHWREL